MKHACKLCILLVIYSGAGTYEDCKVMLMSSCHEYCGWQGWSGEGGEEVHHWKRFHACITLLALVCCLSDKNYPT